MNRAVYNDLYMTGPTNFRIGAGKLEIDYEDVGLTNEDGMIVHYEPDVHLHYSGKFGNTPVKASLIGQVLTLEVTVAEQTLANVMRTYAGVTLTSGRVQFGGLAGREIDGKALKLSPFDDTEPFYFKNAVPTSAVEAEYSVKNERLTKVTFTALVDIDALEAENLGYIGPS